GVGAAQAADGFDERAIGANVLLGIERDGGAVGGYEIEGDGAAAGAAAENFFEAIEQLIFDSGHIESDAHEAGRSFGDVVDELDIRSDDARTGVLDLHAAAD